MMVNIGTGVALVNVAFSSSRSAALIERKVLQCTTLAIKHAHCTLSELKTQVFTLSDVLACVKTLRGSETTLEPGLFHKIY